MNMFDLPTRAILDTARAAAGITIRKGTSTPHSLIRVERWMVRQDSTFRFFRSEVEAEAYADDLAQERIAAAAGEQPC